MRESASPTIKNSTFKQSAEDFVKRAGDILSKIHIGGGKACEKKIIASSKPLFPCLEEEGDQKSLTKMG